MQMRIDTTYTYNAYTHTIPKYLHTYAYINIHSTYIWHINAYINTFTTIRATRLTASAVSIISHFIVVVIATRLTIIIRTLISSASDSASQAARGKRGRDTFVANRRLQQVAFPLKRCNSQCSARLKKVKTSSHNA